MTKITQTYVRQGRDLAIVTRAKGEVLEQLLPGVYRLCYHPTRGWWFSSMQPFMLPERLYGDIKSRSHRILDTYNDRRKQGDPTGILLSGVKGSGKTLLAKKVAIDSNLPIIIINDPHTTDDFKEIIANVGPCVLIFDEFEKVYAKNEQQNTVLTLLNGVFSNEVLSFIIVNDSTRLVGALLNRPGRLYYAFEYGGLSEKFIIEYADDRLEPVVKNSLFGHEQEVDKETTEKRIKGIISIAALFKCFTFDHLQAMVEEMNRYGESAEEVIEFLNVKIPKPNFFEKYEVRIWNGEHEITHLQKKEFRTVSRCPTDPDRAAHLYFKESADTEDYKEEMYLQISKNNLISVSIEERTFTFQSGNFRISYKKISR